MKVRINWIQVDKLKKNFGQGIEIYYDDKSTYDEGRIVAFVNDFLWLHGLSDTADVWLLKVDSPKYARWGVEGRLVQAEVKRAIRKYVSVRKLVDVTKPISRHLTAEING